jgi:hypothetical protein
MPTQVSWDSATLDQVTRNPKKQDRIVEAIMADDGESVDNRSAALAIIQLSNGAGLEVASEMLANIKKELGI